MTAPQSGQPRYAGGKRMDDVRETGQHAIDVVSRCLAAEAESDGTDADFRRHAH